MIDGSAPCRITSGIFLKICAKAQNKKDEKVKDTTVLTSCRSFRVFTCL